MVLEKCDASAIALPESSFDAVVARNVPRPGRVLAVMREEARLGAIVRGPVENDPFHGLVLEAARAEAGWGERRLELATAFARGQSATYETALSRAGFRDVRTQTVGAIRRFPGEAAVRAAALESPIHTPPIASLDGDRRARACKRVEDGYAGLEKDGAIEVPAEWLVVGAAK